MKFMFALALVVGALVFALASALALYFRDSELPPDSDDDQGGPVPPTFP